MASKPATFAACGNSSECACGNANWSGANTVVGWRRMGDVETSYTTCTPPPTGCRDYDPASWELLASGSDAGNYLLVYCQQGVYRLQSHGYYAAGAAACLDTFNVTTVSSDGTLTFDMPLGGDANAYIEEASCNVLHFYVGGETATTGSATWEFDIGIADSGCYPSNDNGGASRNPLYRLYKLDAPPLEITCVRNHVTLISADRDDGFNIRVSAQIRLLGTNYNHPYFARLITYLDTGSGYAEQHREVIEIGGPFGHARADLEVDAIPTWQWTSGSANWSDGDLKIRVEELDGTEIAEEVFDWSVSWAKGQSFVDCTFSPTAGSCSGFGTTGAYATFVANLRFRMVGLGLHGWPLGVDPTSGPDDMSVSLLSASGSPLIIDSSGITAGSYDAYSCPFDASGGQVCLSSSWLFTVTFQTVVNLVGTIAFTIRIIDRGQVTDLTFAISGFHTGFNSLTIPL